VGWRHVAAVVVVGAACGDGSPHGGGAAFDAAASPDGAILTQDAADLDAAVSGDAAGLDAAVVPEPETQRLLYTADQETDGVVELYLAAVHVDGEIVVEELNGDTAGRSVSQIVQSASGDRIAFVVGNSNGIEPDELYMVQLDGATAQEPMLVASTLDGLGSPAWSPDGARLAYITRGEEPGDLVLAVADVTGAAPFPIDVLVDFGGGVADFAWSPDSRWIAYHDDVDAHRHLFAKDVTEVDPVPVQLDVSSSSFADVRSGDFEWAEATPRIFYIADQDTEGVDELYVVDLASGTPTSPERASMPLASGDVEAAYWSPDGSRLAYLVDGDDGSDLHAVDLTGNAPVSVNLSASLFEGGHYVERWPVWSPDSTKLAFFAAEDGVSDADLYGVDLSAASADAARLHPASSTISGGGSDCRGAAWSHDSNRVSYASAEGGLAGQFEVFTVTWTGATPGPRVRSSAPLPHANADVGGCPLVWSPVRSTLLYVGEQDEFTVTELFAVRASQLGSPEQVNAPFAFEGDIFHAEASSRDWAWSPDGGWVAYLADQDVNERVELYVVAHDDLGTAKRVNLDLVALGDVRRFWWIGP
jgi:Tol biopolymer transport system component